MVVRATPETVALALFENEPFDVVGRLLPRFEGGSWTHAEQPLETPYQKVYEDDLSLENCRAFLERPKRAVFLYLDENGACLGRVRVRANWNGFAFLEDIAVRAVARGNGVGTALFFAARDWAKEEGLSGLTLETQDVNLPACRFYEKMGMELGGVDNRLYANFPETKEELALFWYLKF